MQRSALFRFAKGFCRLYVSVLPAVVYKMTLGVFVSPKATLRLMQWITHHWDLTDDPVLGSVDVIELVGSGPCDVNILGPYVVRTGSSTSELAELATIAYMAQVLRPQRIFEVGTYTGMTTRLFAANSGPECRVTTLDLPPNRVDHEVGHYYRGTPEEAKIEQLYGDSREVDLGRYENSCDLIWVDGCHDYEYVRPDSHMAFRLCKEGGWVLWHDYRHSKPWEGVTRFIRELRASGIPVLHIKQTTIAALQVRQRNLVDRVEV